MNGCSHFWLYPCCSYWVVRRVVRISHDCWEQAWWFDCWGLGSNDVFGGRRWENATPEAMRRLLSNIANWNMPKAWLVCWLLFQNSIGYLENTKKIMEVSKRLQKGYFSFFLLPYNNWGRGFDFEPKFFPWVDQTVPHSHEAFGRGICYFQLCFSLFSFEGGRCCSDFESNSLFMYRIEEIPELFIIGRPDMTIVAFGSNVVDIFEVNDSMSSKGWHLNALQRPNR